MRLPLVLLATLLLAAPLAAAGGTVGCEPIPHGFVIGIDSCSVTFTSGPGLIRIALQGIQGSIGDVFVEGDGPGNSAVMWECPFLAFGAVCAPGIELFAPASGPWTFTVRAELVNALAGDTWMRMDVTYP